MAAPIALVVARLLQGLSVGGEYSTSATYLSEVASTGKRGFYSSFQYVTLTAGQLLALGLQIILQQVLTKSELTSWGWRIAFGIGEAPLLRQGTISVWSSAEAMKTFAYRSPQHAAAVAATPEQNWYAEELFTRFALLDATGTIDGMAVA